MTPSLDWTYTMQLVFILILLMAIALLEASIFGIFYSKCLAAPEDGEQYATTEQLDTGRRFNNVSTTTGIAALIMIAWASFLLTQHGSALLVIHV